VPVTSLYFPPAHEAHGPPFGPVAPMLHVQFTSSVLRIAGVKEFAGHAVHGCKPSQSLYVLYAHSLHGPPSGPVNPGAHEQIGLAATDDWFCPHTVHCCTPISGLNLPISHATHACAYTRSYESAAFSTCVYEISHMQLVTFVAAATEFLLCAHATHAADPVTFLYLPTTHATQTSPVLAVYPGLQRHSALAASDMLFAWQLLQPDVPAMRLYVPAGHAWHASGLPVNPALHWHPRLPGTDTVLFVHDRHCPCAW
jgi:hypothetical protein